MKYIITLILALFTLTAFAGNKDSLGVFPPTLNTESQTINLRLNKTSEARTNGFLMVAGGLMFSTIGVCLENKRKADNIPDGYFGYSKRNHIAFNYSVLSIGVTLSITGGTIIYRLK